MSSGETGGGVEGVRDSLQLGLTELGEACTGPLITGRVKAERIADELFEYRLIVGGVRGFFRTLQGHIEDEVEAPYRAAQQQCGDATTVIIAGLGSSENDDAVAGRQAAAELAQQAGTLLHPTTEIKQEKIGTLLGALDTAVASISEVMELMRQTGITAEEIQRDLYPPTVGHTQRYIDGL